MKSLIALALVMFSAQFASAQPARVKPKSVPMYICTIEKGSPSWNGAQSALIGRQVLEGGNRLIVEVRNSEPRTLITLTGSVQPRQDGSIVADRPTSPMAVRPGFNTVFSYKEGKAYLVSYRDFVKVAPTRFTCNAVRRPFEGGGR
ncbi:MAG: hypothetical protein ABL958_11880 [Bdellovibrionia bacterium]